MARLLSKACFLSILAAILLSASSANAATCYQFVSKDVYPNCIQLDANVVLYWRTIDNNTLEIAPDADGYLKWIAIGISEAGMKGVDFSVTYLPSQGSSWLVGDFFTVDFSTPTYDVEQNVELVTMPLFDNTNHTLAVMQRPLDSCDTEDTPVYLNVERSIIWAYDETLDWDHSKTSLANFTMGITTGVRLFTSNSSANSTTMSSTPVVNDPLAKSISVNMSNYIVSPSPSSVVCMNLALPNDTQYHVTEYTGFSTTPFVTRLVGYVCAAGVVPPKPFGVPYNCSVQTVLYPKLPDLPAGCETVNFVWVPGAKTFKAPPEAGFLIGANASSVLVLQTYYINLKGTSFKTDSSGFNLTITPTLRQNNLGVLTVGSTGMNIPPNNASYTDAPNICPAECTSKRVLSPVTLVSNLFVMGGLGKSMLTRHIRNGTAIMPVGRINYWDVKYMGFQSVFPGSTTLLANDTLINLCTYNSTGVTSTTSFGVKNGTELCFNFITFYPTSAMPNLDYCIARTRDNVTTCGTRSQLSALAKNPPDDFYWDGAKVQVGPLNISYYKSQECQLHDATDVTPYHPPNTRAAVASIILVPICLILVGVILWTKYSKQEELEALLQQARAEGIDPVVAD